jgi:hypothetical protein
VQRHTLQYSHAGQFTRMKVYEFESIPEGAYNQILGSCYTTHMAHPNHRTQHLESATA